MVLHRIGWRIGGVGASGWLSVCRVVTSDPQCWTRDRPNAEVVRSAQLVPGEFLQSHRLVRNARLAVLAPFGGRGVAGDRVVNLLCDARCLSDTLEGVTPR